MNTIFSFLSLLLLLFVECRGDYHEVGTNFLNLKSSKVNYKLPDVVDVEKYTIQLSVYLNENHSKNFSFDGVVNIDFKLKKQVENIILQGKNLSITSAELIKDNLHDVKSLSTQYEPMTQFLKLYNGEKINPGNYTLKLRYIGKLNQETKGLYRDFYVNEKNETKWYASTYLEPIYARRVFPCFDEPKYKANFDLTINHHKNYSAISNAEVKSRSEPDSSGRVNTSFELTPKLPTYAVAFLVSDFSKITNKHNNHSLYARTNAIQYGNFAMEVESKIMKKLEEFIGIPLELNKIDLIAMPESVSAYNSIANWGLIKYGEDHLLYRYDKFRDYTEINMASNIAFVYARQWFGNLVTHDEWKHMWLNEGLAFYLVSKISEEFLNRYASYEKQGFAMNTRENNDLHHTVDLESSGIFYIRLDVRVQYKVPCVVHMLENILTSQVFKRGLSMYLSKNKYGTGNLESFYEAMEDGMKAEKYELPYDLKTILDSWLNNKGYPILNVTRDYNSKTIAINQDYAFAKDEKNVTLKWYIPINVATKTNPDFIKTTPDFWLTNSSLNVSIEAGPEDWIILNKQQTGFYRVNYDEKNWKLITDYLKTTNHDKIHPINRNQLMTDALELYNEGILKFQTLLDLVDTSINETDLHVWLYGTEIIRIIDSKLINTKFYSQYTKLVAKVLEPVLELVGFEESENHNFTTKQLRIPIVELACYIGDVKTITYMQKKLESWLDNPYNISINEKSLIFPCGLRNANFSLWKRMYDRSLNETDYSIKLLMTASLILTFEKNNLFYFLNELLKDGTELIERQSLMNSIILSTPVGVDAIFDFILDKISTSTILGDEGWKLVLKSLSSRITTKKQLEKLEKLRGQVNVSDSILENAKNNIKWLKDHDEKIKNWLKI